MQGDAVEGLVGFDLHVFCGQQSDRSRPVGLIGVVGIDQIHQDGALATVQFVHEHVVVSGQRRFVFADQHQIALAEVGVEIEAAAQVGREIVEVIPAVAHVDGRCGTAQGEAVRFQRVGDGHAARADRVVQQDAVVGFVGVVVGGFLIDDIHAELSPDLRKTITRREERVARIERGDGRRPGDRPVHRDRQAVGGVAGFLVLLGGQGGQPGNRRTGNRLTIGGHAGEPERGLHGIVVAHDDGRGGGGTCTGGQGVPGVVFGAPGGAGIAKVLTGPVTRQQVQRVRTIQRASGRRGILKHLINSAGAHDMQSVHRRQSG